ncbi:hypothetical protein I4U23_022819 [Adineta vaga]|nr:hypothetical protein I4U23_022819 [Adineta vaga]
MLRLTMIFSLKGDKISPVLTEKDTSTLSKINSTLYILIEVKRPPMIIHVEKSGVGSGQLFSRETRLPGNPYMGHANAWLFQLDPSQNLYCRLFEVLRRYSLCRQPLSENNIVHFINPQQKTQRLKYVQQHRTSIQNFLNNRWPNYSFETKFELMKLISKHIITVHDLVVDEHLLDKILAKCSLKTFTACIDKIIEFAAAWLSICGDDDDEDSTEEKPEAQTSVNTSISFPSRRSESTDLSNMTTVKMSQMMLSRLPSSASSPGLLSHLLLRAIKELKRYHEIVVNSDNVYITKNELILNKADSFLIRKIYITPPSFLYEGPYREEKCRVTRQFESEQDCFLRVSFRDENYTKLLNADIGMTKLYERVKAILTCGLGQSFSTTIKGSEFQKEHFKLISDIKTPDGKLYTDGIGIITKKLAEDLSAKMNLPYVASAFQIRCGGFKGMVSIDVASEIKEKDVLVYFRNSMDKFDSFNLSLDIVRASHNAPAFLNRQIILLLSSLGIHDHVFLLLQRQMLDKVLAVTKSVASAEDTLEEMNGENGGNGTHHFMIEYLRRFGLKTEPFVRQMLLCFQAHQLKQLRTRARIFVRDGCCLLGVVDESKVLRYGEVFVQIEQTGGKSAHSRILQGAVIVTRNPCFHPGDIRRLEAVDIPCLHGLKNVIVFPCQGPQSHANPRLIFEKNRDPLDYEDQVVKAKKQAQFSRTNCYTIEDVCDFFAEYMKADNLGFIANSHLALADQLPDGAENERCIQLAKMHSVAVDFAKSGVHAENLTRELRPTTYPHFMEKGDKPSHSSTSILGKLYNESVQINIHLNDEEHNNIDQFPYSVLLIDDDSAYNEEGGTGTTRSLPELIAYPNVIDKETHGSQIWVHHKLILFAILDHITDESTSEMCVQERIARSIQSQLIERTANMTDAQIVTSALSMQYDKDASAMLLLMMIHEWLVATEAAQRAEIAVEKLNVSTDDLISWVIPFYLIEQYAAHLNDDGENAQAAKTTICNCSHNRNGRHCEYSLPSTSVTPGPWLNQQMATIDLDSDEILTRFVDGIICPGADMFLEWRHICDGFIQCQNGADELNCQLLEYFQCEPDEFQCRNGMCIPSEFAFDAMPDCLDWSDEQELDELYKRYADCPIHSTFDCDDRLCRKDQFSCGNGECVPWSAVLNDKNGCKNARHIAYICEVWGTQQLSGEWFGICKDTMKLAFTSLTNNSDCRQTLGHLLQIHPAKQSRQLAVINLRTRCDDLILYSEQNAFFPGLKMLYNRSRIVQFFNNTNNFRKPIPKTPDFYYFTGDVVCDDETLRISRKIWFDHQELQKLTLYPFFPLLHFICQKIMNQSLSDKRPDYNQDSSITSSLYRCDNTSDHIALRRINDGYIDCLYGDDERNPNYPMTQPFRYRCQTVTSPSQYISYTKLGNGVEDCADGSDEISNELRWSTLKCYVNDAYACWVFQGDRFQENRLKDTRLHFHRYCDSNWDTMNGVDEKNCSNWICDPGLYQCSRTGQCIEQKFICDGEFDCNDGEDEVNCSQRIQQWKFEQRCNNSIEYFCITDDYLKNQSLNRSCILWHQVGDGNIDCIGARDERNVASCHDYRMLGDRFLCDNGRKCIDYSAVCNGISDCLDGTDESICYWNTGWCSAGQFSCADQNGCKSIRCTRQNTCKDKSQYFWCPNSTNENYVYRTQKVKLIVNNKKTCYGQTESQMKLLQMSSHSDHEVKQSSIRHFYCNRGFYLQAANSSELFCFCPPTFYGDRCQFNSRRVSVRLRFDRAYRQDLPIVLNVLVTLVLNKSVIIDHRFFLDEAKEHPSKYNTYLIYSRPKPPGMYSVRIEVYHSIELIHFWEYSVSPLDFLPVLRIAKVLRFPARSLPWFCSHNFCQNNATCYQRENIGFLCICTRNWKGRLCEMRIENVHCSSYSLARTESICVCPRGYFEPYCYVQNLKCQWHNCDSNEICIPKSHPPINGHICICNTSDCNINRPVISVHRNEPNQQLFLLQLLQLAGDYPTIRQQILIPPSTSFPLIQTIKTRDDRYQIAMLPEIGLLFTFESTMNSIESTLYLLFINCSDQLKGMPLLYFIVSVKISPMALALSLMDISATVFTSAHIVSYTNYLPVHGTTNYNLE